MTQAVPTSFSSDSSARRAAASAIDREHLAAQTLGDTALEADLLALFAEQVGRTLAELADPANATDAKRLADLAHRLKGSARAIGAKNLAAAAQDFEDALRRGTIELALHGPWEPFREKALEASAEADALRSRL